MSLSLSPGREPRSEPGRLTRFSPFSIDLL
jgi:hypothetical protein